VVATGAAAMVVEEEEDTVVVMAVAAATAVVAMMAVKAAMTAGRVDTAKAVARAVMASQETGVATAAGTTTS